MGKLIKYSIFILILFISGCADELVPRTSGESEVVAPVTKLLINGLDANKPITMQAGVQVAYNRDTIFFHITWQGNKEDTDEFLRFTSKRWQLEGGDRRESQSTIDGDSSRGRTTIKSTNAESSVSFVLNDPQAFFAVPNFRIFGCFIACHDDNNYMPRWDSSSNVTMYLPDDIGVGTQPRLDLWVYRAALGGPVGWADDQSIDENQLNDQSVSIGGRSGEKGDSPFDTNLETDGTPKFLLDSTETDGEFVFNVVDRDSSKNRFFMNPATKNIEPSTNNVPNVTKSIAYLDAIERGYVPKEGDVIPAARLRESTDRRGDISALDSHYDEESKTVHVGMQRLLNTSDPSNPNIAEGKTYEMAFAIHTGDSAGRDHYISYPITLTLSNDTGQLNAVKFSAISGVSVMPDFSDVVTFPITNIDLVLPGITSYEFVTGANSSNAYFPKDSNQQIKQTHTGSGELLNGIRGCNNCHTIDNLAGLIGGATSRGGVLTPTPTQ